MTGSGRKKRVTPLFVECLEDRSLLSGVPYNLLPVVPQIDPTMQAHLQEILGMGLQLGNRPDVFAKVGDSITATAGFLTPLGSSSFNPQDPSEGPLSSNLASTLNYFRSQSINGTGTNSFNRVSLAAGSGWMVSTVLTPSFGIPLEAELNAIHPAFALVMLGTNDNALGVDPETYRQQLTALVEDTIAHGVIPVLSTIPDDFLFGPTVEARVPVFNQIISDVAADQDVPVWNFWAALQPLPNLGISVDNIHPSSYPDGTGIFTPAALEYGFNVRNLTALEVLDKLRRVVLENGAPDPDSPPPPALQFVTGLYQDLLGRAPDQASLDQWGMLLVQGTSRQTIATLIWQSPEHRAVEVQQYYNTFFHRQAGAAEVNNWVGLFEQGFTEGGVQEALLNSPEYQEDHPDNAGFVTSLYQDLMGRTPGAAEVGTWVGLLNAGASRTEAVHYLLNSPEKDTDLIKADYLLFLGRQAQPPEEANWLAFLGAGFSPGWVGENLLASEEFWLRW